MDKPASQVTRVKLLLQAKQPRELLWTDAKGQTLTCTIPGAPSLRAKNDEVLRSRATLLELGGILGVELKKRITPKV